MTPFVPQFTPQELEQGKELLRTNTPESIEIAYRRGEITLRDKVTAQRIYGQLQREMAVRGDMAQEQAKTGAVSSLGGGALGEVKYYYLNVLKEFQSSWDAATREGESTDPVTGKPKRGPSKSEAALYALMGSLEALKIYDLPGNIAERWALDAGISPGLARAGNWAIWGMANFFGLGAMLKAPLKVAGAGVRGVKAGTKALGSQIDELGKWAVDPVGYAAKQAMQLDAKAAVSAAKVAATKAAGDTGKVIKAVSEAESRSGNIVTSAAKPDSGMVRVYRGQTGEFKPLKTDPPLYETERGRWFTTDETLAKEFGSDVFYVDIPKDVADAAISPDSLYNKTGRFLPVEWANKAQSIAPNSATFIETPQDLERMTMIELVNHYAVRAETFARKGTKWSATKAEAQAAPFNFEDVINRKPGEPISAVLEEKIGAVHEQVKRGFDAVLEASAKQVDDIAAGNAPDLAMAFKAHLQAIELTNPEFLGTLGEAGRALNYAKTFATLSGESRLLDSVLKSLGSDSLHKGSDAAVADAIQKMVMLTKEGQATFLKEAAKPQYTPDIKHSLFKTILFLSPSTHVVNMTSGQAMVGAKMLTKTAESLMPFSGGPTLDQTKAMWTGMFSSLSNVPRVWRQAVERSGLEMEKYGLEGAQDVLAKYGTGRLLAMEDEFISAPLESALIQSAAIGRMQAAKLPNKAAQVKFLDDLFADAGKVAELKAEVAPEIAETMFRAPLSSWGETGAKWIRNSPLDFWLPIIKFPINSLKIARDWTPGLQVLSKKFADEIAEGGAKEAAARTRMTLAWMNANMIWSGAKAGIITGGGPTDPDLKRQWLSAGNVPYAINGIPIRWMEPFGTVVGTIADIAEVSNQMDPGDVEDFIGGVSTALGRAVENNYWIRILEGLTQVVTDVKHIAKFEDMMRTTAKVVFNPVTTVATGGPIGARVREQFDPEIKDIRTIGDFYKSKIPGWSKDVRPALNYSGKPRLIPPVLGQRWLSFFAPPLRTPDQDNDPVAKFMTKHEISVEDDWKSFGGSSDPDRPLSTPTGSAPVRVNLDGNESHDWKKLSLTAATRLVSGKTWVETIEELDNDPNFDALPRYKKNQKVRLLWRKYKDLGEDMLKAANPDVYVRSELAKTMTKNAQGRVPFAPEAADVADAPEVDMEPQGEQVTLPPDPTQIQEAPQ